MGGFLELFSVSAIFGWVPKINSVSAMSGCTFRILVCTCEWVADVIDEMLYDVGFLWILEEACMVEDECTKTLENKGFLKNNARKALENASWNTNALKNWKTWHFGIWMHQKYWKTWHVWKLMHWKLRKMRESWRWVHDKYRKRWPSWRRKHCNMWDCWRLAHQKPVKCGLVVDECTNSSGARRIFATDCTHR